MDKYLTRGGFVAIDRNTIATHELVAAVAGKRIVVTALVLSAHGAQVARFLSNNANKTGRLKFADAGGMVCLGDGTAPIGIASDVGQNLQMSLTAAIETGGWLVYGLDEG